MKKRGIIIFILLFSLVFVNFSGATTYYVDYTLGSDSYNGTETFSPWKTVAKVDSVSFNPGDEILFKRGEIWENVSLFDVANSGNSTHRIIFGSYGSGIYPHISCYNESECISFSNKEFINLENFSFSDANVSCVHFSNSSNIIVKNIITYNSGNQGFQNLLRSNITYYNITSYGNMDDGFSLHDNSTAYIYEGLFYNNGQGINYVENSSLYGYNITIFNSTNECFSIDNGIDSSNYPKVFLNNFTFYNCGLEGLKLDSIYSSGNVFNGHISNSTNSCIYVAENSTLDLENVTLFNCTYGLYALDSDDINLTNIEMSNFSIGGIYFKENSVKNILPSFNIKNMNLYNVSSFAIKNEYSNLSIFNSSIYNIYTVGGEYAISSTNSYSIVSSLNISNSNISNIYGAGSLLRAYRNFNLSFTNSQINNSIPSISDYSNFSTYEDNNFSYISGIVIYVGEGNKTISRNIFHNNNGDHTVDMASTARGVDFFYNLFYDLDSNYFFIVYRAGPFGRVVNNLFYDSDSGARGIYANTENVSLYNNIFSNLSQALTIVSGAYFIGENNNFYGNLNNGSLLTTNNFSYNPLFVNITSKNFNLREDSPLIDLGKDLNFTYDLNLNYIYDSPDIGPFEYSLSKNISILPLTELGSFLLYFDGLYKKVSESSDNVTNLSIRTEVDFSNIKESFMNVEIFDANSTFYNWSENSSVLGTNVTSYSIGGLSNLNSYNVYYTLSGNKTLIGNYEIDSDGYLVFEYSNDYTLVFFEVSPLISERSQGSISPVGSTGSSTSLNFNEGVIKRGFPKGHVLKFDFGNLIVGDFNQNKIILNFDSSNVEINLDESKKIDLDEDGFYDIQVMYSGTYNNFADLVITEIHKAVSGVISEVKTDINNSQGEEIEIVKEGFFRKLWNWINNLFMK